MKESDPTENEPENTDKIITGISKYLDTLR